MKRTLFATFFLLFSLTIFAQGAKKYVLLEHFTNSNCPICASRNPAFYNTIQGYEEDIHHIAYHPNIPYPNCVFQQANPADNNARKDYYNIPGTPRLYMLGTYASVGTTLLPEDDLIAQLGQTSPIEIIVETSGQDANRTADITINTVGNQPSGNLKLFVAVVEKDIFQTTGNGEDEHHDVLRDFISDASGDDYTPAITGESISLTYNFTISNDWVADEIYVLAFVQEYDTKEVLNSGSSLDIISTSNQDLVSKTKGFDLFPNPADDVIWLIAQEGISSNQNGEIQVFSATGKLLFSKEIEMNSEAVNIDTRNLIPGFYLVKLVTNGNSWTKNFIKR